MAGIKRSPARVGKEQTQTNPPCMRMKRLRERAGYNGGDVAGFLQHAGIFKKPVANNWYRYENPKIMKDDPLPYHLIEKLIPHFVGRGSPPITADELIAISTAKGLRKMANVSADSRPTQDLPLHIINPVFANDDASVTMLQVEYRAEMGVWMDSDTLASRSYGISTIASVSDYPANEQMVALVADTHADPVYRRGTQLHCLKPKALRDQKALVGKRVLVKAQREGIDLCEIVVGQVEKVVGNTVVVKSVDGRDLDGEIVGVVLGRYEREW